MTKCPIRKLLELTFLKLSDFYEEESQLLTTCCKLRELCIDDYDHMDRSVVSSANLTKLEVGGIVVSFHSTCTSGKIIR